MGKDDLEGKPKEIPKFSFVKPNDNEFGRVTVLQEKQIDSIERATLKEQHKIEDEPDEKTETTQLNQAKNDHKTEESLRVNETPMQEVIENPNSKESGRFTALQEMRTDSVEIILTEPTVTLRQKDLLSEEYTNCRIDACPPSAM